MIPRTSITELPSTREMPRMSRGRHILVCAPLYFPHIGGAVTAITRIGECLAARGWVVDILTCGAGVAAVDGACGVRYMSSFDLLGGEYPVPRLSGKNIAAVRALLATHYDVIYTYGRFYPLTALGFALSRMKGVPLVHSEFGSTHTAATSLVTRVLSRLWDHTLGAMVLRGADVVTATCRAGDEFVRHLGARSVRIVCPPTGLDFNELSGVKPLEDYPDGWGKEHRRLVYVGRLVSGKGVQDAIDALAMIKVRFPAARLAVVGDGPYRKTLEARAASAAPGMVVFLGTKPWPEAMRVVSAAEVVVSPSYSEGLMAAPVAEGGALGVPSVTTPAGGTLEVVQHLVTAYVCPAGDLEGLAEGICALLGDGQLRERLSINMRRLVRESFGWSDVLNQYLSVVEGALASGSGWEGNGSE